MAKGLPPLPPLPGRTKTGRTRAPKEEYTGRKYVRYDNLEETPAETLPWGGTGTGRWHPTGRKSHAVAGRCAKCGGIKPAKVLIPRRLKDGTDIWICKGGCD